MEQPAEGPPMDPEDQVSITSIKSIEPSPHTLTKLVKRLRLMTLKLLPVEVDVKGLEDPTSRVITAQVIEAYIQASGDFLEALPYCLLRTRQQFMWDANHNPADYGENEGRAIACEVLARRIVHRAPPDRITTLMSTRFKNVRPDGDVSDMASALEVAIDTHCIIFLSSSEAQDVVLDLWNGELVQKNNENHDIDYVRYDDQREHGLWGHINSARLAVPRYQNFFRIWVWIIFLIVYSQAVREPLDKLDPNTPMDMDAPEIILYIMALSFTMADLGKWWKLVRFVTWRAFGFWDVVSFLTDGLLLSAFIFRIIGMSQDPKDDNNTNWRLKSFQVLSFVAPLIWMKLITVFDGYKYIGTMQITVARMLKESGIFFALLTVQALGFAQGLYALDAADGNLDPPDTVVNLLIQALLQAPNFDRFQPSPAGLWLYYFWNVVTAVILLNVLISLFSSAYEDVVDDAEAEYLAFFASKTIGMIRAPDEFVYPAPFNLVEIFLITPFELLPKVSVSSKNYAKINHYVMTTVFFLPLVCIAIYEVTFTTTSNNWVKTWFESPYDADDENPSNKDPEVHGEDAENGLGISRVKFDDLIKAFPNTEHSSEATVLAEIIQLKKMIVTLTNRLEEKTAGS